MLTASMAFNGAADRIEKQLRRYTNRLKDHKVDEAAQAYVENAGYTVFSGASSDIEEVAGESPAIVAETRVDIPESSVSDAVMLMDLRNTTALMFKNSATGQLNMWSSARSEAALLAQLPAPIEIRLIRGARRLRLRYDDVRGILKLTCPTRTSRRSALKWALDQRDWIETQLARAEPWLQVRLLLSGHFGGERLLRALRVRAHG